MNPFATSRLVIEIDVPAGIPDAEIVAIARRFSLEADRLHRAHGGHGLRVVDLKISEVMP